MRQRYCGENIVVCAAGDLEHDTIVATIEGAFRGVPAGEKLPVCSLPSYRRRLGILEKGLEQVHICLGTRALPHDHPNRFVGFLLNAILGGSMSSRLFQHVREELGLVYSIYSYLNNHSDTGAMVISSGTSPEETPRVIGILLQELRRFKNELVSESELHATKEQLKGNLMLSMESTDNRMTRLARNEIYLGRSISLKDSLRGIERVDREEIRQLAEFLLRDDYLNLQMVGNIRSVDYSPDDLTLS